MRAVMCAHPKAVLAPAPRPSPPRARDARSVPARRVSSNYRAAVGGGPSAPTRGETCSTSSSAGDGAVTSHLSHLSTGEDWRVNAFSSFCDAASARPRVHAGLQTLAQRHPAMDPSMVLFALWLAVADDGLSRTMTHAELRAASRVAERWRGRVETKLTTVHASLRGADLEDSPAAEAVARVVAAARRDALAAARAELFREAERWRRFDESLLNDSETTKQKEKEETPFAEGTYVRGATSAACANLSLLLEYLGAPLGRTDWKHARAVFEGCMAEGSDTLLGGGWDVEGDVRVWGNADGDDGDDGDDDDDDDDGDVLSAKQWRSVRCAIDARFAKDKTATRKDRNRRYHAAKKNLEHANRVWKETAAEYKRARSLVKSARHEVHKSRAAVRTQFR